VDALRPATLGGMTRREEKEESDQQEDGNKRQRAEHRDRGVPGLFRGQKTDKQRSVHRFRLSRRIGQGQQRPGPPLR
jgi:hypothetical protein